MTSGNWAKLILFLTLFLSLLARIFPALLAGFPLNDGGMFYVMARDLRANHFLIPPSTTYNYSGIPFAYPPLGFYIVGLLGALGLPDFQIFLWFPILVSLLTIPAFYLLAKTLLNDNEPLAALATVFFALTPGNYDMEVMGGGVTRSLGALFLILSVYSVYRMLHRDDWKSVLLAILFCSLAVLSHPEVILATATASALLCLFYVRSWRKVLFALSVAVGVVALTAFWWVSVLMMHGLIPFLSVIQSGAYGSSPFVQIYLAFLAPASLFTLAGILRLIGVLWSLSKRHFILVAWLVLPYFVEPRSAGGIAYLPSCMLIAVGLGAGIPYLVDWMGKRWKKDVPSPELTRRAWFSLAVFGLMFYWFIQGAFFGFSLANTTLKPPVPQETLTWVRNNTPKNGQFLILTGNDAGLMSEPIQEWFPALAERRSQVTLQGLEWTLGDQFFPRLEALRALQQCETSACVEQWSIETKLEYAYVLISKTELAGKLLVSFSQDKKYTLIYENSQYAIFKK